jgi:methyl-accepting chemotaxis protein
VFGAGGKVIGIVYVGIATTELDGMLSQALWALAIAADIAALLVLAITMLIVRRVTRPLRAVTEQLTAIAEGSTDVEVRHTDRHDEIGTIARTIGVTNRIERHQLEAERITTEQRAVERRKADLNQFTEDFRSRIGGIIDRVLSSSGQVEKDAQQLLVTARPKTCTRTDTGFEWASRRVWRFRLIHSTLGLEWLWCKNDQSGSDGG